MNTSQLNLIFGPPHEALSFFDPVVGEAKLAVVRALLRFACSTMSGQLSPRA